MKKLFGYLMILTALVGLAASVIGLGAVWRITAQANAQVDGLLGEVADGVRGATDGLDEVASVLDSTSQALSSAETAVEGVSGTLGGMQPALQAASSSNLRDSLEGTRRAVASLQQAGAAVDSAMLTLSMLDPGMDYDPDNSLAASLAEVGEGLEGLSGDLATIQTSLEAVEGDLSQVQTGVDDLGENLADIRASMENAAEGIDASVTQLNDLADRVDQAGQRPRRVITTTRWIASALLVWLGLSQLAPLHVGLSLQKREE